MSDKKTTFLAEKSLLPQTPSAAASRRKIRTNRTGSPSETDDNATKELNIHVLGSVAVMKSTEQFKKCVTTKKLKGKVKEEKTVKHKDPEKPALIWDETLADLQLAKKRKSVFQREIGINYHHVRIVLPTPEYNTFAVKKTRQKLKKSKTISVLKPAPPDAERKQMFYYGPQCDDKGHIVPYSILGEVTDFVREADRRGHFKEILKTLTVSQKDAEVPVTFIPSPRVLENPKLNEDKALQSWDREMTVRKMEMKRLADILERPEKQLLMSNADDYVNVRKGRILIANAQGNNHPDVCFWKLQATIGHQTIRPMLTNRERGIISTPVLSGDAASIRFQKGALREPLESSWFNLSYLKEKDEQVGGVIKISNQMLFDELEVCGKSVSKQQKSSDPTVTTGSVDVSPGGDASVVRHDKYKQMDILEEKRLTGPCLKIDNTILKWVKGCYHGDAVAKITSILIEGYVDKVETEYICFHNCGTTVLKYHWKRAGVKLIPIARPRRMPPFYINHDDGIILPGDTAKIEVNFRSRLPGYFKETWLLGTVPVVAAGAQIKFVLKGIARVKNDFSQEMQMLQEMLKKREINTLCSYLAKELLRDITLKAYLESIQLHEDIELPSEEALFVEENPGHFYHGHIVKKLKSEHRNLTMEVTGCSTPSDDGTLSVAQLTKLIMSLPEPDLDDEIDEADLSFNRKELLLWQLCHDVSILSFPTVTPLSSLTQQRYRICYQLLRKGTEDIVCLARHAAACLGLEMKNQAKDGGPSEPKTDQEAKVKASTNSAKLKGKKVEDSNDFFAYVRQKQTVKKVSCVFLSSKKKYTPALKTYDEKLYIMVYNMLCQTVDKMVGLFEN